MARSDGRTESGGHRHRPAKEFATASASGLSKCVSSGESDDGSADPTPAGVLPYLNRGQPW